MISPDRSQQLFDRARAVAPGGVNSPVRGFGAVGGTPRFMAEGNGPYLFDVDGGRYVDLVCSWGPLILGHAHPAVVDAVCAAAGRGTSFGAPTENEVRLAEEIVSRVAPVERVRLVNSGTEATMTALRLARGFTGRDKIVKFAGCYHGHVDSLLVAAGSGAAAHGVPDSSGVTGGVAGETIVLPYNDPDALSVCFQRYGDQIASVITEACPGNMGVVPPRDGLHRRIAELCRDHGSLFILDEVLTGFRVSRSGWYGLEGVRPDLMTFGKVMGGGLPAAAFGGRADVMDLLAPSGPVYQAGTLSGNPLATAAGLATLGQCGEDVYERLDLAAATVARLADEALTKEGVPHQVQLAGNILSVFFADEPVTDFAGAGSQDTKQYAAFFHALLEHGVHVAPSAFESWFVSAAHDEAALDQVAQAMPNAARAAAKAGDGPGQRRPRE